ncbi:MAG TPA: glycosyltransferase family 2 protein, partial [Rhodopila sp.]|nr:glycosyltransferase family 2 protein [Rhodopila sp.]
MHPMLRAAESRRPIVVAIPAKDEADQIGPCLTALQRQTTRPDTVLLLLNNCTDTTATVARALAPTLD